jgi:hypothetical protein
MLEKIKNALLGQDDKKSDGLYMLVVRDTWKDYKWHIQGFYTDLEEAVKKAKKYAKRGCSSSVSSHQSSHVLKVCGMVEIDARRKPRKFVVET